MMPLPHAILFLEKRRQYVDYITLPFSFSLVTFECRSPIFKPINVYNGWLFCATKQYIRNKRREKEKKKRREEEMSSQFFFSHCWCNKKERNKQRLKSPVCTYTSIYMYNKMILNIDLLCFIVIFFETINALPYRRFRRQVNLP